MAEQPTMTALEKWKDGLRNAVNDSKWNNYDCEIKTAVDEYNRHLGSSPGFRPFALLTNGKEAACE